MYYGSEAAPKFNNPFFIGTVEDNKDPTNAYRIKVRIPTIHHNNISTNQLPWAAKVDTSFMGISNDVDLLHTVPEIGTQVLVLAMGNDINSLVYLGSLYKNTSQTPSGQAYFEKYGIYTKKGEFIGVDKIKDVLEMIWNGDISIKAKGKLDLNIDGKIKIGSNAQQAAVLGDDLTTLLNTMIATFNAHTHTGNLAIPTSSPQTPMTFKPVVSKKVTVE